MNSFLDLFSASQPIIGMVHLLAMPNSSGYPGFDKVLAHALQEFEILQDNGIDGVLIENDNDSPHSVISPAATTAVMTAITKEIVRRAKIPVGVEVLLNDPQASLSIALASGAQFIRTDYFIDHMSRPEYGGEMAIDPAGLIKYRSTIGADQILILTDIQVKHATLLETGKTIVTSVRQAEAASSDGVIISGNLTGQQPLVNHLQAAYSTVQKIPVLVGSGFAADNASELLSYSHGAIVGTSLKTNGHMDSSKVSHLMKVVHHV